MPFIPEESFPEAREPMKPFVPNHEEVFTVEQVKREPKKKVNASANQYPFAQMRPGSDDSFVIVRESVGAMRSAASAVRDAARNRGMEVTTRQEARTFTVRVWRIK